MAGYTKSGSRHPKPSKEFSSAGYRDTPPGKEAGFRAAPSPKKKSGLLSKLLLATLLAGGAWAVYHYLNLEDAPHQPEISGIDCSKSIGAFFTDQYRPWYQQNQYPHERAQLNPQQNGNLAAAVDRFESIEIEKYDGMLLSQMEPRDINDRHRKLIEAFHAMNDLSPEDAEIYALKQLQQDLDKMREAPSGDYSTPEEMLTVLLREAKYKAGSPQVAEADTRAMNANLPKYRYVRHDVVEKYARACPSLKGPGNS